MTAVYTAWRAKVVTSLHVENKNGDAANTDFNTFVFTATKQYIQYLSDLYGNDNESVDNMLKELIIDRAFIDAEERKTKFSELIEAIPVWYERKQLFEFLIELFPENPHYYNHLARLLARGNRDKGITPSFEKAVECANRAIYVACDNNRFDVSTHYTNLGCIYSQWILYDLYDESRNAKNAEKHGHFTFDYPALIDLISLSQLLVTRMVSVDSLATTLGV